MKITKRRLIFKISTSRLKKAKWNLRIDLDEARNNNELIALGDSQVLRWIDELNGVADITGSISRLRHEIRMLAKEENSAVNRHRMQALHDELDSIQFVPDYIHVVANTNSEYLRAVKGFKVNGIKFARLVGTNGGLKNSTVVFVNEKLVDELRRRIDNGRDKSVKLVPGKFEAYRALVCSGSIPVSMPKGVIVVDDLHTHFKEDVIMLNDEGRLEPLMTIENDFDVDLNESDGYGLMLPSLAQRWSDELGLGYMSSAFCTRESFEKGMAFTFDFIEFAEKIAGSYEVIDAWGDKRDVREAELILTVSMLKLWNAYPNIEAYLAACEENHYTFAITKTAPEQLEDRRALNYQFIQSYDLTDEQIEELIAPTMQEFKDVLAGDWRKALLFMCGLGMNDKNIHSYANGYAGAIMAEPEMFKDPHIKRAIYNLIKHRIDQAKIGVLNVHGNYSIVAGDPYALCQHIFGLEVTGLMKAGEIFNKYWYDDGAEYVACFRAPMSCHNNIRKLKICRSEEALHWYQYITTGTLLNCWDTVCASLNGMDKDGDLVMLTNNSVLVDNIRPTKTIFCIQRNAEKVEPTEETQIKSNLKSFGDDIGKTTNKVTSMYDVQSYFDKDSVEYQTLEYRIQSGQLYQQNCIDKIKGIVCDPMPRSWFDYHANALPDDASDEAVARREFNLSILAEKKPYFMRYIYPTLMKQYKTYMRNVETKCAREFRMSLDELLAIPEDERTDAQENFISYYERRMPVGIGNCVMNRICRRFESEFDGKMKAFCEEPFDYTIMKSGAEYTSAQVSKIRRIYEDHNDALQDFESLIKARRITRSPGDRRVMEMEFRRRCLEVCSNADTLCDIVLDMCYCKSGTKSFAWDICSHNIILNLAKRHDMNLSYPSQDDEGDIEYCGKRFAIHTTEWVPDITEDEAFERDSTEREGMGEEGD